jgi:hypothetical protein
VRAWMKAHDDEVLLRQTFPNDECAGITHRTDRRDSGPGRDAQGRCRCAASLLYGAGVAPAMVSPRSSRPSWLRMLARS